MRACQAPRLIILHGPAGCGKTMAALVAARELRLDVVEWVNPVDENAVQSVASSGSAGAATTTHGTHCTGHPRPRRRCD